MEGKSKMSLEEMMLEQKNKFPVVDKDNIVSFLIDSHEIIKEMEKRHEILVGKSVSFNLGMEGSGWGSGVGYKGAVGK